MSRLLLLATLFTNSDLDEKKQKKPVSFVITDTNAETFVHNEVFVYSLARSIYGFTIRESE